MESGLLKREQVEMDKFTRLFKGEKCKFLETSSRVTSFILFVGWLIFMRRERAEIRKKYK